MAMKIEPIILPKGLGKKWWQTPDVLWRKFAKVRHRRLRLTLSRHILPLLQKIEAVQLKESPQAILFLKGKTLDQVTDDPMALEFAIYLYELALSEGLVKYISKKGAKAVSIRSSLDGAVGSCGITPNEVTRSYILKLASPILKKGGHNPTDIDLFLSPFLQTRASSIERLRLLAKLSKEAVNELRLGLSSLDDILEKDEKWLHALCADNAAQFLRSVRIMLRDDFSNILNWPVELLQSAISNLDRPEKIRALGDAILEITNPAMFESFGSWPSENDENGVFYCRIVQVKEFLGDEIFSLVAKGSPELVKDMGAWPQAKINAYKPYFGILTGPALRLFDGLDEDQVIAVLDGLVEKFEMPTITKAFKKKEGLVMMQGLTNDLKTMNRNAQQTPEKIKKLVLGTYFDDYTAKISAIT